MPFTPIAAIKGLWTERINLSLVVAAAAMLPNGKVLLWSAYVRKTRSRCCLPGHWFLFAIVSPGTPSCKDHQDYALKCPMVFIGLLIQ